MTDMPSNQRTTPRLPGEEPACLQIAAGLLGTLLLILISLLSHWHWSGGTSAGVAGLLAGMVLILAAGFSGLRERWQARAASLMVAGDVLVTVSALVFLVVSFNGVFSWAFPLGSIFTTLALFSDLATLRFRRAVSRTPRLETAVPES